MNKQITNVSKWMLLAFITTLLFFTLFYWWGWQKLSVSGTDTCFTHSFVLEKNSSIKLMNDLKNSLERQGYRPEYENNNSFKWDDKTTYVMMYLNTTAENEHQVSVCTADKKSKNWQIIAIQIENLLPRNIKHISTDISLDPVVLGVPTEDFYSGFNGKIEIALPITLEKLQKIETGCKEQLARQLASKQRLSCN